MASFSKELHFKELHLKKPSTEWHSENNLDEYYNETLKEKYLSPTTNYWWVNITMM